MFTWDTLPDCVTNFQHILQHNQHNEWERHFNHNDFYLLILMGLRTSLIKNIRYVVEVSCKNNLLKLHISKKIPQIKSLMSVFSEISITKKHLTELNSIWDSAIQISHACITSIANYQCNDLWISHENWSYKI